MKEHFKFLCTNDDVCPEVKEILERMGFKKIKDRKNSIFDISAEIELDGRKKEDIGIKVLKKCKHKVQQIEIN
jgi:hypothetical protein